MPCRLRGYKQKSQGIPWAIELNKALTIAVLCKKVLAVFETALFFLERGFSFSRRAQRIGSSSAWIGDEGMRIGRLATVLVLFVSGLAILGCKKDEPERRAPPPPAPVQSAKASPCASGGGTLSDAPSAAFLPRIAATFCLDPNGGDKAFGEGAPHPLDGICDLFDGECEVYKGFQVKRVLEARYVDGAGSTATITVYLSKYGSTEGAYGMFTKRVVGDGDPADEATPKPIEGGGAAALGVGNAYLWRGPYLAEITYNDDAATEAAIRAVGERVLPGLVKEMGLRLVGETALPPAAAALPKPAMLPLGVRLVTGDLLGISGLGPGAFGYYREEAKRYRYAALARGEVEQAKDVLAMLGKQAGAAKEKGVGDGAVRLMRPEGDGPAVEWLFARAGKVVLGIGDEARVLRSGMTSDEVAKVSLSKDEKAERLKKALSSM